MNVRTKFEVRSFTRSWEAEIIGVLQKFGQSLDTRTLPFLQNFSCFWMDPVNVRAKFEVCSFTRSWDNSFGWGLRTSNLREGGVGVMNGTVRKSAGDFCRPSIVTFPLALRVSEILLLLCSSTPLFPTTPVVSPKFPHVPLGVGGWRLGYEERGCWANCPCIIS